MIQPRTRTSASSPPFQQRPLSVLLAGIIFLSSGGFLNTNSQNKVLLLVDAADCSCPGPYDKVKWAEDESKLGDSSVDTCSKHDDDNSWFTSLHFDEEAANPTMQYRFCERKKTRTVGGTCSTSTWGSTYTARYVTDSYEDTPTCGDWKKKTIPDETNFKAFYDHDGFEYEQDISCGSRGSGAYYSTYCTKTIGPPDNAVLAYSKTGTVCFRYNLEECDVVDQYCWGTSQRSCDYDSCETQCYTLTDPTEIFTHSFITYGNTPVYYVEITFNNKDIKGGGGSSAGSTIGMMKAAPLYAISFFLYSFSYFFF